MVCFMYVIVNTLHKGVTRIIIIIIIIMSGCGNMEERVTFLTFSLPILCVSKYRNTLTTRQVSVLSEFFSPKNIVWNNHLKR